MPRKFDRVNSSMNSCIGDTFWWKFCRVAVLFSPVLNMRLLFIIIISFPPQPEGTLACLRLGRCEGFGLGLSQGFVVHIQGIVRICTPFFGFDSLPWVWAPSFSCVERSFWSVSNVYFFLRMFSIVS